MIVIATIDGVQIGLETDPVEKVSWLGKLACESDGRGPSHGDPCYQPDTSLHRGGKPLDADTDCFIAIPPIIRLKTKGRCMGCRGTATNILTGVKIDIFVGDEGPPDKIGEGSCATNRGLGFDPSPLHGGTSEHIVYIEIYPGQMAV